MMTPSNQYLRASGRARWTRSLTRMTVSNRVYVRIGRERDPKIVLQEEAAHGIPRLP
jgi:hypothetical protein